MVECIGSLTLATHDRARAVRFYRVLGFEIAHGGEKVKCTSLAGTRFLNLNRAPHGANLVLVGTRHLLSFRRRHAVCERDRDRVSAGSGAVRRGMGRAFLSLHRSRRSRAELRLTTRNRADAPNAVRGAACVLDHDPLHSQATMPLCSIGTAFGTETASRPKKSAWPSDRIGIGKTRSSERVEMPAA